MKTKKYNKNQLESNLRKVSPILYIFTNYYLFILLFRATRNSDERIDPDQLYNSLKTILTACRNHQSSWPFHNPVDRKAVPDYYDHIKFPMDLKTMTERLKANYYVNKRLFIADMKR